MKLSFAALSACPRPTRPRLGLLVLAGVLLGGCSSVEKIGAALPSLSGWVTPYRIDILQGNVVVREQVQALKPGMPREQVRAVLGTPLVQSVFHADRWDYVFTFQRQGQPPQRRVVTVFFKGDSMERVEADELPTEEEFVATLDVRRKADKAPVLEATEAQLQAFQEKNSNPATAANAPTTPSTPPPGTSYPPLEPR